LTLSAHAGTTASAPAAGLSDSGDLDFFSGGGDDLFTANVATPKPKEEEEGGLDFFSGGGTKAADVVVDGLDDDLFSGGGAKVQKEETPAPEEEDAKQDKAEEAEVEAEVETEADKDKDAEEEAAEAEGGDALSPEPITRAASESVFASALSRVTSPSVSAKSKKGEEMNGQHDFIFPNGDMYSGLWEQDKPHGDGRHQPLHHHQHCPLHHHRHNRYPLHHRQAKWSIATGACSRARSRPASASRASTPSPPTPSTASAPTTANSRSLHEGVGV
jgi:hypothetical protein